MKLAISNIAWKSENDKGAYELMRKHGFLGLEIAPTKIFGEKPYECLKQARLFAKQLKAEQGFNVVSMQSIWYGKKENLFNSRTERLELLNYTKKAVDFANAVGCKNLVFGCPKNRAVSAEKSYYKTAVCFFKEISQYALGQKAVIALEANPVIYNTNFINTTASAIELIKMVDCRGFMLNLDVGAMVYNNESVFELKGHINLISHVHISEPYLKPIQKRKLHKELKELLLSEGYEGYVSIEMGKTENLTETEKALEYISEVFNE